MACWRAHRACGEETFHCQKSVSKNGSKLGSRDKDELLAVVNEPWTIFVHSEEQIVNALRQQYERLGPDTFLADQGTKRVLQQLKLDHPDCTSIKLQKKGPGIILATCKNSDTTGCTTFFLKKSNNAQYCQECREKGRGAHQKTC